MFYLTVLHSGSWKLLLLLFVVVVVVVVVVVGIPCQVAKQVVVGSLGSRVKETITV